MQVFSTVANYQAYRDTLFPSTSIGFVPTMGALHPGHLSLIEKAREMSDKVVVSIFVNPLQFNENSDFVKYPKPLDRDIHMLCQYDTDVLFLPTNDEMYPPGKDLSIKVDLSAYTEVLEGKFRPGHFDGVITVVHRLLKIIQPDFLFMGLKDFQQQTIIRHLIESCSISTQLQTVETVREEDGLAMSSRNVRIDTSLRPEANKLYETLMLARELRKKFLPGEVKQRCLEKLAASPFEVEYFEIVSANNLQPVTDWKPSGETVACVAAWLNDVRLIDNMML